jgi:NAD(P)-dependent dehydrogenase (short-subunit alcohol dehydrogenase family)
MGAKVYTGCRRFEAAGTVIDDLQKKGEPIKGQLNASYMDLADLVSVQEFANRVKQEEGKIDMLILDAAIAGKPYKKSTQGHEIHYATNHLGHYCLTRLLLNELLANKARVVVVDSMLHSLAFREGRPTDTHSSLPVVSLVGGWLAYNRSNLTKLMFAYELQRRYPELTVPIVHPGVLDTNLSQVPTEFLTAIKAQLLSTAMQGAQTPLYCATAEEVKGATFYHNVLGVIATSSLSYDPWKQQQVWELSERLCEQAIGPLPKPTSAADVGIKGAPKAAAPAAAATATVNGRY